MGGRDQCIIVLA